MSMPHPGLPSAIACLLVSTAAALAAGDEAPRPVTVTRPVHAPLVTAWELTGSVTAQRDSRLSARTSGLIQRLLVDAGDTVAEGDTLMELDPALAVLALERATAARKQAELELAEAERLVAEGRNLANLGGFSRSEAETRETAVRVRRALLESLSVQVREQEETIARHRLPAPFGGVISRKLAEVGEWVQTGTPVLELVETTSPWIDVQAPQEAYATLRDSDAPEAHSRLEITVRLDAFPEITLPARIVTRVPVKDVVARTFLVRLALEDPEKLAAPGMSGQVRISLRGKDSILHVHRDAVVRLPDGTTKVWVVEPDGKGQVARSKTVQPGRTLASAVEIRGGLEGTPLLVLRGNENLRDGQPVTVLSETPPPATVE